MQTPGDDGWDKHLGVEGNEYLHSRMQQLAGLLSLSLMVLSERRKRQVRIDWLNCFIDPDRYFLFYFRVEIQTRRSRVIKTAGIERRKIANPHASVKKTSGECFSLSYHNNLLFDKERRFVFLNKNPRRFPWWINQELLFLASIP